METSFYKLFLPVNTSSSMISIWFGNPFTYHTKASSLLNIQLISLSQAMQQQCLYNEIIFHDTSMIQKVVESMHQYT